MKRRLSDVRSKALGAIAAKAKRLSQAGKVSTPGELIKRYYADVADEDLASRENEQLAAAALSHYRFGEQRRRGQAKIRVFNPDAEKDGWDPEHTIVQIVNDDMPFLVDSVGMALGRVGVEAHLTIHPLLRVIRTPAGRLKALAKPGGNGSDTVESFIHVEITRETDPARMRAIEEALAKTLGDVRAAVEDWQLMLARLRAATGELRYSAPPSNGILEESCALLDWMADDNFTLLGYREYSLRRSSKQDELSPVKGTGLGLLRDESSKTTAGLVLTREMRKEARSSDPLIITKANTRSTVHRPAYLDYIGVKIFDDKGVAIGERRFLGLFTSVAYSQSPREIPLLRLKVSQVVQLSGLVPSSHRGKALQHILDTFPRDELFQASVEDLARTTNGILNLQERQRVRLFIRRDTFRRFYSCLVFVPRERYNTNVRKRIEKVLLDGFDGTSVETEVSLSESALARLYIIVDTDSGRRRKLPIEEIQQELAETVRTWQDRLRTALLERVDERIAHDLLFNYAEVFPEAYKEDVTPIQASYDIQRVCALDTRTSDLDLVLYQPPGSDEHRLRFKIFRREATIPLSEVLPMLETMGLKVISERPYRMRLASAVWIQDFELTPRGDTPLKPADIADRFQSCFKAVLSQQAESDGFNGLVIAAGLDWREAALIRAYCKYLVQTGIPFSQAYMQEVLSRYPGLCRGLIDSFAARFDPDLKPKAREQLLQSANKALKSGLAQVGSLDEDRILRGFLSTLTATLRTNFYQYQDETQTPKPYISFKLDPTKIPELPLPRPRFEIFVYSPRVEGVHLRGGSIARGGLRWSDRREDFRTEILGLMKAQQVKNTVIVPTGAKGGFVCKQLPQGDREKVQAEVVACYSTFIRGLLDITDNLVDDKVVNPKRTLRQDGDDPYLVVAADKGTATFSDIANGISSEYGFWLGDAFASGGSAGYDHKKMAITARGAWEAVKRHFRELSVDVQSEPITVAAIGDMSGDVFGNGMLQSKFLKLQAAFNHQHIFLDPEPDPAKGYAERQRLFDLPRSSWLDYDEKLLSAGGGIYSRDAKSIQLHPKARAMLDLEESVITPPDLIKAILRMRVDLLWNGGIGTYVKAASESHIDAGDRANDSVRVDGCELRCQVVGEGGNLGLTQLGRVEFALHQEGLLNTDFIDNSGGVDCSDREVNIKILLNQAIETSALAESRRDKLLADMTEEVSNQVLRNNYRQTQAISMMAANGKERLSEHARLLRILESSGLLDRNLEFLPSEDAIEERRTAGLALTRPELAVMLSYAKIDLYQSLVDSDVPEDAFLARELQSYFPERLQKRFKSLIPVHRLRREIIATLVAGSIINRMGPMFALRAIDETGSSPAEIARAYTIVREIFDIRDFWTQIEALDNEVQAEMQYAVMFKISRIMRRAVYWMLHRHSDDLAIEPLVKQLKPGVQKTHERPAKHDQRLGKETIEKGSTAVCRTGSTR